MKKWWRLLLCLAALNMPLGIAQAQGGDTAMEKVNIGKKLALYPSVVTVVGA